MPFYSDLKNTREEDRRTAEGLLRLRTALDAEIPAKSLDRTLLLASWNLREFGGRKYGGRTRESLFYLAEILSRFDLIAVQEVRAELRALDDLVRILGRWWKYVVSDVTSGSAGNQERLAFLYDSRSLSFGGLAGELVPPAKKVNDVLVGDFTFARTPYLVGFQAGWFKFTLCTDHFYYGDDVPDPAQRVKEAEQIVELLEARIKSPDRWARNVILVGDFNVFGPNTATFKALTKRNFKVPKNLAGKYTNANLDKPFDQICFMAPDVDSQLEKLRAGVFDCYRHVYRATDAATYGKDAKALKDWRTYQMSDHLPVWVELTSDFAVPYLQAKAKAP